MMHIKIIILTVLAISLTACEHTVYIAIRNYKEPCTVNVRYQKLGNTFIDDDTLMVKTIGSSIFDGSLVRVNTSANAYTFLAPQGKEIALRPVGFGTLIKQVVIINASDSTWIINLRDTDECKKLRASGKIRARKSKFDNSVIIENK